MLKEINRLQPSLPIPLNLIAHPLDPETFPFFAFLLTILDLREHLFFLRVKVKYLQRLFLQHALAHCFQLLATGFAMLLPG